MSVFKLPLDTQMMAITVKFSANKLKAFLHRVLSPETCSCDVSLTMVTQSLNTCHLLSWYCSLCCHSAYPQSHRITVWSLVSPAYNRSACVKDAGRRDDYVIFGLWNVRNPLIVEIEELKAIRADRCQEYASYIVSYLTATSLLKARNECLRIIAFVLGKISFWFSEKLNLAETKGGFLSDVLKVQHSWKSFTVQYNSSF